eukprot:6189303-Pleurochrysis_carterae.AAC.2
MGMLRNPVPANREYWRLCSQALEHCLNRCSTAYDFVTDCRNSARSWLMASSRQWSDEELSVYRIAAAFESRYRSNATSESE